MNKKEKDIPDIEIVDINLLKKDDKNPNVLNPQQMEALKKNIQRYGFIVPIITNKEYVIADGEHRLICAKELNYQQVPVIRLDVDEVDRRLLRQILNKLKGQHNLEKDMEEYKYILEQEGNLDTLKEYIAMSDNYINAILNSETFDLIENVDLKGDVIDLNDVLIIQLDNSEQQQYIKEFFETPLHRKSIKGALAIEIIKRKCK